MSFDHRGAIFCKFVKTRPELAPKMPRLKYEDVPAYEALKRDPKYMTLIRF